jgi:capping protein beta
VPSESLRKREIAANKAFDIYRELCIHQGDLGITDEPCRYYEGGVSSVLLWDLDDGFAGVVLFQKGFLFHIQFMASADKL